MINLNTPNDVLLAELASDYEKARFWAEKLIKKSEYKPVLRKMFNDHRTTGEVQYSDIILYTSPKNNKWCMYWKTDLTNGKLGLTPHGFAYYETEGSIGAFLPMADEFGGIKKCVILPSHFFLRLKDRLGLSELNKDTIHRLTRPLEGIVIDYKGSSEKRDHEIEISISGSVWHGVFRNGDIRVVEVKTFVTAASLSREKGHKAMELGKAQQDAAIHSRKSVKERMDKKEGHKVFEELFRNEDVYRVSGRLEYNYAIFYTLSMLAVKGYGLNFSKERFREMCVKDEKLHPGNSFLSLLWEVSYGNLNEEEGSAIHLGLSFMAAQRFGYRGNLKDYAKDYPSIVSLMKSDYLYTLKPFLPFEERRLVGKKR